MKIRIIHITLILTVILALFSCETDISVELPRPEEKLVVEGYIASGEHPVVFLTKNSGYFDSITAETVIDMIVLDSTVVTVSDGSVTDTMSLSFYPGKFPYFGYSCSDIIGEYGKEYRLDIYWKNNHYFATTRIPQPVAIDSVWFTLLTDYDSLGILSFRYQDPPERGNYYAYHTRVEGEQTEFYKPYYGSHIDDDLYDNGAQVIYFGITRGMDEISFFETEQSDEEFLNSLAFGVGTNVSVRLSTIDIEHYEFWNSYYRHMITWGNPFTNPATIKSNIEGDPALGIWGGYGTSIAKVHITDSATIEMLR